MSLDPQLARILDANANRIREGLRTAEDYVRFLIGDLQQAGRLKLARQTVTEILRGVPGLEASLIESRNVGADPMRPANWKDVLRRIEKESPLEVAQRGLKRAQEGLRVVEENLRGYDAERAEQIARLRYLAYESEQWLWCVSKNAQILQSAKVYVLLTEKLCKGQNVIAVAKAVLKAGVKLVQLREKELPDAKLLALARKVQALCVEHEALFFCNDRIDMALCCNAHGVHVGQSDLSVQEIRTLSGQRLLAGLSTHSTKQARQAAEVDHADYIGIGSVFETRTKTEIVLGGLKILEEIAALTLSIPVFAIGGITLERLRAVKAAGATRVAVSTAIIGADDPNEAARRFLDAMM